MAVIVSKLDNFFKDLSLIISPEATSNCCDAVPLGELFMLTGRCSECLEMGLFTEVEDE